MNNNLLNQFVLVEYNNIPYPAGWISSIHEVAAHLDKEEIEQFESYSMHTEYSYGKRNLNTPLILSFPSLAEGHKDHVPQLWKSDDWAADFADFVIALAADHTAPTVIEIHPPFNDYCTLDDFVHRYRIFEKRIHDKFPDTLIVIENRAGAVYRGGKFLFSKARDIVLLCQAIEKEQLNLGVVLDFPQLLTAENINPVQFKIEKYRAAVDLIVPYRHIIKGIHIWGKKKSATGRWVAHAGNFDTYFAGDNAVKQVFITGIRDICNDGGRRFLVPEVNTGATDLESILKDLADLM